MHGIITKALAEKRNLLEPEALQLLAEYGLPVPQFELARTKEEAVAAAEKIGYPVVLKIVSPDILHKSDVEGVKVGLATAGAVSGAFEEIINSASLKAKGARVEGVLVVANAPKGTECIVGMTKDPQFGPALMFGLGGIFVELLKDVAFRVLPLTREDAEEMIKETKGYQLLKGMRGQNPKDIPALKEFLLKMAALIEQNPEIQEIDVNPLLVFEQGLQVLDARVIL
ncbi:acetyl-CoA synthetase [Clostridiales bacterium PH28_bin88]|nr:acetyl-CoA synthetase [Clostridiales bacterium PH28_bin88]